MNTNFAAPYQYHARQLTAVQIGQLTAVQIGQPRSCQLMVEPIAGVFLWCMLSDKAIFTTRPKSVPQRDVVAKDESAADSRMDGQIDRSSSASDACTVCVKYKVSYVEEKLRNRKFS
eukprot:6189341-Pleurochrysis_carterae.AAC.6